MADDADDRVELIELDVITRYSLAVRAATADRDELIAVLRDDLRWLEGGRSTRGRSRSSATAHRTTPAAKGASKPAPPKKTARSRSR